ncbi:MAG: deoxyribose-phosphate aldolase [Planctomycetia bacterium]|nr:deoxyribose-phosphate aldolase [Planctomycetia bacterium]
MKVQTKQELARTLDYSILPKQTTREEILFGCQKAREYHFAALYTSSSYWTPLVAKELADCPDIEIGTGISFPFGTAPIEVKTYEMKKALSDGCTAIDMVINCGALRSGDVATVREEVRRLVDLCRGRAVSKCIFDVCFLTEAEIKTVCDLVLEYGVDYAKTSTGQFEGPTLGQVLLMKKLLAGTPIKLKVAGVKFPRPQNAVTFLNAGADRIGTRAAVEIVEAWDQLLAAGLVCPCQSEAAVA